jgi:hypothetical protein
MMFGMREKKIWGYQIKYCIKDYIKDSDIEQKQR